MESTSDDDDLLDIDLINKISEFHGISLETVAYRTVAEGVDPTAFSTNGGRWAPPSNVAIIPVLYTSLEKSGAIAEVVSYLKQLSPPPTKPIEVHALDVTAKNVIEFSLDDLFHLGLTSEEFYARRYAQIGQTPPSLSQKIGAAVNFLGFDGMKVPSARWECTNLVLYGQNHSLDTRLEPVEKDPLNWTEWENGQES